MNRRLSPAFIWACVVSTIALLPYLDLLLDSDGVILYRDLSNVFIPLKSMWVRGVTELGRVPHWDPFHFGGRAFLPDLGGGPLYPLNLLLLPFGSGETARGMVFFIVAHHALMAAGGFLLFLRMHCRPPIAAIGALALAWCGFAFSADNLPTELGGATAMPFFFLGLLHSRKKDGALAGMLAASLALAAALYAGNPQIAYVACLLAPAVLWRGSFPRALGKTLAIAALALLAAGPQLLPTLSYLQQGFREFERADPSAHYAYQVAWSLHPARLFEFLFPYGVMNPGSPAGWAQSLSNAHGSSVPFILFFYPGAALAASLLLIGPAWITRGRRWNRRLVLLLAQALALLLLTLGAYSPVPLYRLALGALPVWERFRYPERLGFWLSLAWITLCVLALERLMRLPSRRSRAAAVPAIAFSLALVAFISFARPYQASVYHSVFFFFAALAALLLPRFKFRAELVLAILAIDLLIVSREMIWAQSGSVVRLENLPYVRQASANVAAEKAAIQAGGPQRVYVHNQLPGPPSVPGANPLVMESLGKWSLMLFNTNSYWGLEAPTGYFALQVEKTLLERLPGPGQLPRMLDLMAVRQILSFSAEESSVAKRDTALPYVSVPPALSWVSDNDAAIALVRSPAWQPRASMILEGVSPSENAGAGKASWKVTNLDKRFDRIELQLAATGDNEESWLLVNESHSAHWHAFTSAGLKLPLLRANGWALGVGLPAARSGEALTIELRYAEPSFFWGCCLFAVWAALAVAVWFRGPISKLLGSIAWPRWKSAGRSRRARHRE